MEVRSVLKKTSKNAPNHDLLDAILYCHDRIAGIDKKLSNEDKTSAYLIELLKYIRVLCNGCKVNCSK